jgi:hypothetical protein
LSAGSNRPVDWGAQSGNPGAVNGFLTLTCDKSAMTEFFSTLGAVLLKAGIVAFVANEVRGFILAAPILYGMYLSGGSLTALWIGFCSLAGVFLSVVAPLFVARKFKLIPIRSD